MFLVLTMLLSLAACGKETDVRGEQINNNTSTQTPEKSKSLFSMGKVSGLTYENKFIGIGCKLSSEWSFCSDDEIKEMNNLTAEMAGEEFEAIMQNASLVYDMYAVHSNGMDNIIVNLEKVGNAQLATLDLDQMFTQQMPVLKNSFENMGYTNLQFEIGEVTIGNKTFVTLFTEGDIAGYHMVQANIAIKCDGYLACIAVTCFGAETLQEILNSFYLL